MDKSMEYIQETQTLIGERKRELVDVDTGERILVDQITKRVYGTKAFWKVYLADFLMVLGIIDSKQLDIFIYIVEHTDPAQNLFIGTYKEISAACNVSEPTIAKIMKKLQANNFIKKRLKGVWYVNPNIIMKGNDTKRQILLSYYENDNPVNSLEVKREPATVTVNTEPTDTTRALKDKIIGGNDEDDTNTKEAIS